MAKNCREYINELKKEKKILEKALELLKDKGNYYNFVDERTEIIDVDFAILKAREIIERGQNG